jgi:DNA-directed RNA polymerase specialized sigma subunit
MAGLLEAAERYDKGLMQREIATEWHVTHGRVAQIHLKALAHLRHIFSSRDAEGSRTRLSP